MKALVVDDDPGTRRLLSRILVRDHQCAITEAADGLEALSLVSSQQFDLVLLDILMPLLNGVEVLGALRRSAAHSGLPVMVLSAVRDERRVREAIQLGVSDYLSKPLRPDATAQRVRRFVSAISATEDDDGGGDVKDSVAPGARVALIDGDVDFRHFFTEVLHRDYAVSTYATGAEGLAGCRAQPPAAIFVGRHLGVLGEDRLLTKLRRLPEFARTRIVALVSKGAAPPGGRVDGTVARTYLVEPFQADVTRALQASGRTTLLDAHPALRRHLISATEQVFGMMLTTEVDMQGDAEPPQGVLREARVDFDVDGRSAALSLRLQTSAADACAIAARMSSVPVEAVAAVDADGALGELLGVIAGRLRQALSEAGPEVVAHPAIVDAPPDSTERAGLDVVFRAVDGSLTCRVLLVAPPLA
jgi:CheY-like chemotaxis protein